MSDALAENRILIAAGSGPLCGKESRPTHIPVMTLSGIDNTIDLAAKENVLKMPWSCFSHSRHILRPLPAGLNTAGTYAKTPG